MASLTTQKIVVAGTPPVLGAAAAGGDTAEVGARTFLVAKNTNAASRTLTVAVPGNLETGDAYPDKQYTLAATNGEQWIPLLNVYGDSTIGGRADITYSSDVNVTVAVVRIET